MVALVFILQVGHKYLLSFVSLSTEKNCFSASAKVESYPFYGKGTFMVNVSSNVSDVYLQARHKIYERKIPPNILKKGV